MICSEGNAGFYEIGIMVTPLEAGYSVLGWNHPGFGGSTVRYRSVLGYKMKCCQCACVQHGSTALQLIVINL